MRVLVLTLASVALSACCIQMPQPIVRPNPTNGPTVPTGAPMWQSGSLQLGASNEEGGFMPLANTVPLLAGFQGGGGRHVFLNFRVVGQTPTNELYLLVRANRSSDGTFIGSAEQPMGFNVTDAGASEGNYSYRLVLCPTPAGVNIVDEELTIEAYAFSRQGGTYLAKASATVKPQCSNCQPECGG